MRFKWNLVWLALLAVAVLNCTGCGGFTGRQGVSPATFLLPGLLKNETANCTNTVASIKLVAPVNGNSDSTEFTSVR